MGQFAQQFKDYAQYDYGDCYRKSVPANLSGSLAEVLVAACGPEMKSSTATTMQKVTDDLLIDGRKETHHQLGGGTLESRYPFRLPHLGGIALR